RARLRAGRHQPAGGRRAGHRGAGRGGRRGDRGPHRGGGARRRGAGSGLPDRVRRRGGVGGRGDPRHGGGAGALTAGVSRIARPPPGRRLSCESGAKTGSTDRNHAPNCDEGVEMRDAVIVEAVRTPVGKRNGGLSGVHPVNLSAHVLNSLAERSGVDPGQVEDVIWGCVSQVGEQTMDIGRTAALAAGWPETVTGVTVDRQCGSSQQSVHFAAAGLIAGQYDVVVAGGVESMSRVPMGTATSVGGNPLPAPFMDRYGVFPNQGIGAEMIAEQWGFSRTQVDEFSVSSHEKAAAARDEGRFDAQIAPVTTDAGVVAHDEGIRESTVEKLGTLKSAFKEDGVITAGNSSQIS